MPPGIEQDLTGEKYGNWKMIAKAGKIGPNIGWIMQCQKCMSAYPEPVIGTLVRSFWKTQGRVPYGCKNKLCVESAKVEFKSKFAKRKNLRNQEIYKSFGEGLPLEQIGGIHGISRQRVEQIILRHVSDIPVEGMILMIPDDELRETVLSMPAVIQRRIAIAHRIERDRKSLTPDTTYPL